MSRFSSHEQEIIKSLIDTKAVNFEAIGSAFAKQAGNATLLLDGEDFFCGTMRRFIRLYRLNDTLGSLEQLGELQKIGTEMRGG